MDLASNGILNLSANLKSDKNNFTELISGYFEKDMEEVTEWIDPYDSLRRKILTVFVYIIEVLSLIVMFAFVYYETSGFEWFLSIMDC